MRWQGSFFSAIVLPVAAEPIITTWKPFPRNLQTINLRSYDTLTNLKIYQRDLMSWACTGQNEVCDPYEQLREAILPIQLQSQHVQIHLCLQFSSSTPQNEGIDSNSIFIEAHDAFLNSLQPSERSLFAKCSSAEDLITEVRENEKLSRNPSLIRRSISKLDTLNQALSPYFDAIGLFTQSHPEFAAIAWGAIKLALQVSGAHFTDPMPLMNVTVGE